MNPQTDTLLIVGLGLIGGSYAQGLRAEGFRVIGLDRDPDTVAYALETGMIQTGSTDPGDPALIAEADGIICGLYPNAMVEWILANQQYFRPGIFLTDVSGVKRAVLERVQSALRPDVELIGSHPMAGREVSGVWNSDPSIFRGANFIVTPTERNTEAGIGFAEELGQRLGFGRISRLSPAEHDEMIGYLSQLTHAIAVSLMNANDHPHLVEYTGDSFRDLTRIAKINEELWSELFFANRDILISEIDRFSAALGEIRQNLSDGDEEGLKERFRLSTARRRMFEKREIGPVPSYSRQT